MPITTTSASHPFRQFTLLLACLIMQIPVNLFCQSPYFERIPNELGLSQNFISAVLQDRQGFLWVGTKDGLNRFDGYHFEVFQHDPFDSTSITGNYIKTILEDSRGRLWIGTTNGLNRFEPESETFQRLNGPATVFHPGTPVVQNHTGLSHGDINCMLEDQKGNFWIGTLQGGVTKIVLPQGSSDLTKAHFTIFTRTESEESLWDYPVTSLAFDEKGDVWVNGFGQVSVISGGSNERPYHIRRFHWDEFDPHWKNYSQADFRYNENGIEKEDHRIYRVIQEGNHTVWIMSAGGFGKWNTNQSRFERYDLDIDLKDYPIPPLAGANGSAIFDRNGRLWAAGGWSAVVYDTQSHKILLRHHLQDPANIGLPENAGCRSITEDSYGNIWLGTNGNGLFKYSPAIRKFDGQNGTMLWKGNSVRSILETSDGSIWMGLTNLRLMRLNRKTGQATPVILDSRWSRTFNDELDYIYTMIEDRNDQVWLGAERGLFRFRLKAGEITDWTFFEIQALKEKGKVSTILDIHEDDTGQLWLLTPFEFGRFFPETGQFEGYNYLEKVNGERLQDHFPCIYQQKNGIFWLGTHWGLLRFDPEKKSFDLFTSDPAHPEGLSHPTVKTIYPDPTNPEQVLWIGTAGGGLNRFDLEQGTFTPFKKKEGLPDNVVYGILGDETGKLWLSTNQGLSRFDPQTGIFKNYHVDNGLQDNEFNSGAYNKSRQGELFFGGINGLNAFFPTAVDDNIRLPEVRITGFKLANKKVDFRSPGSHLSKSIIETEEIVLNWEDKIFSFEFASLDLTAPDRNQYAYRLDGFHTDWQYTGTERSATFTNLNPGKYTFRVKASNHDGVWNENGARLSITILPPWWQTWWACLGYLLLLSTTAYAFYRFQLNRKLEQAEAARLKEMDTMKTRLYTNITHEFRTPLTVIMGITEQVANGEWKSEISTDNRNMLDKHFSLILRNSRNLLQLINQMLELSQLDSGTMKMKPVQRDIITYLQYLSESFYSLAQEKKLQLHFKAEIPELIMDFDEEMIQQITYNLLSNAIKFTGAGGSIVLQASLGSSKNSNHSPPYLILKVQDTGTGIPEPQLPYIFDRFYQVDGSLTRKSEGTGIGLALTKEWVERIGGNIQVESTVGKGTSFILSLPVIRQAGPSLANDIPSFRRFSPEVKPVDETVKPEISELNNEDNPVLLVIEDNADVVAYIRYLLERDYQIHTAPNGKAGLDKAFEIVPDIIVSDVMMPEMDGYEVCEILKNDELTSHIPIILLTAKATEANRITGLKKGADAYLMKPFNKEELRVRLEQLVSLRNKLREHYSVSPKDPLNQKNYSPREPTLEDIFLQKIRKVIEENIDDTELGTQHLCRGVNLSYTQVFRKMKALTGENPTMFIRKIRLQKAVQLLKTTQKSISEIAYDVGFSDPNYFSRVFHEEFDATPSSIRN